jgi:MFS family permease
MNQRLAILLLEALGSAAFILIGSKVGDRFGRKRGYVLGLHGYAGGAIAMALAQDLIAIIVFWAVIGGLGASLLLPAMQSLIHGNFESGARKKVYALVGAAAAIAAGEELLAGQPTPGRSRCKSRCSSRSSSGCSASSTRSG